MEPSAPVYTNIIRPIAAILPLDDSSQQDTSSDSQSKTSQQAWELSPTNPATRVNSLDLISIKGSFNWLISSCSGKDNQFHAYPEFAIGRQPKYIDIYTPDQLDHPPALRQHLQSGAIVTCRSDQVADLGISKHLKNALVAWSSQITGFESVYDSLPFRSRIVVENIASNVTDMRIRLSPKRGSKLYTLEELKRHWQLSTAEEQDLSEIDLIPLSDLKLLEQRHAAISYVRIPSKAKTESRYVFKIVAPDRFQSGLIEAYHELKLSLTSGSHPNIVSNPLYLVTETDSTSGICGFILPFYKGGSLLETLSSPDVGRITLRDRVRWSIQITSALIHLQTRTNIGFHADLKPDNVLFTANGDAVLVDMEQRGGWDGWFPPEINAVWCLSRLARPTKGVPSSVTAGYRELLEDLAATVARPDFASPDCPPEVTSGTFGWTTLMAQERDKAMAFMLGKTLWCIFEHQPTIYTDPGAGMPREAGTWISQEYSWPFPEFRRTPRPLQNLVKQATLGADEWTKSVSQVRPVCFDIESGLFVAVEDSECMGLKEDRLQPQQAAKKFWQSRLEDAEAFVRARMRDEDYMGICASARGRPTLQDILNTLTQFET